MLNEYDVRAVFHLAAQTIVGIANRSPLSTWDSNVRGTYTLLEACRAAATVATPVERIVVASSDKAYGDQEELPYREETPLLARYPYDVSKACTDLIARSYAATYELPVAVSRLANVYGGGDLNFSRLVPDTARALARGRAAGRALGRDPRARLDLRGGRRGRLPPHRRVARRSRRCAGRAWNAGSGTAVPVLELVRTLSRVSGRDLRAGRAGRGHPRGRDRPPGAGRHRDPRARSAGEPAYELEEGLAETWRWYERWLSEGEPAAAQSSGER